jgi:hypothetical protein
MSTQGASDGEGECMGSLGLMLPNVLIGVNGHFTTIAKDPVDVDD